MQKRYYSFTRLAGLSGNQEAYINMLNNNWNKHGKWNVDQYKKNRKQFEKWIIRGIGDALKFGNDESWIIKHFTEIVRIFNHYPRPDTSVDYIKTTIGSIKSEALYHPYGIRWINITPKRITRWVHWRQSFTKDSDWRLYCAIDLFNEINPGKAWISVYTPSNLERTAGVDRETRKRSLIRLEKLGWITSEINQTDHGIRIKVLKMPKILRAENVRNVLRPEIISTPTTNQNLWYKIHRLISGRPPLTRPHPDFPLIFTNDTHLHLRLGTVSIRQMIAAVYSKEKLNESWKKLRKDSASFRLHEKAYQEVLYAPKKMPYPVDDDIENNKSFQQQLDYQDDVAFPAMDRGLPFDIYNAKIRAFRLLMAYYGQSSNTPKTKKGKRGVKKRLNYLNQCLSNATQWDDHRVRSWWDIRGTVSNRTVLKRPDIQNFPKDLRYLLQNEDEILEWHDIKGQEIYITILESKSKKGMEIIDGDRDLMQEIADSLSISKDLVKGIIHPRMKGKGKKALKEEYGDDTVEEVLKELEKNVPEAKQRKEWLEGEVQANHGELPETPLGRTPVTIDQERISTCAIAIMDQSVGTELTKQWAIHYARTEEAKRWPIVLDMHDAIVTTRDKDEDPGDRKGRNKVIAKTLKQAAGDLKHGASPAAESEVKTAGENRKHKAKQKPCRNWLDHNTYCGNLSRFIPEYNTLAFPNQVLVPP